MFHNEDGIMVNVYQSLQLAVAKGWSKLVGKLSSGETTLSLYYVIRVIGNAVT